MPGGVENATRRTWMRPFTSATSFGLLFASLLVFWLPQPATSATSTTTTMPAGSQLSLEAFDFSNPSSGFGVFTRESPSGLMCRDFVGRSTDGGAVFHALVNVMSWNCSGNEFGSSLTTDGHGDAFLYGPQLFVSHDNAKTWARSPQSGSVLDVDAIGLSVWMVVSTCAHAETGSDLPCPVHVRQSSNGGRTWESSLVSPSGDSGGISSGAHGQSYLIRVSRSSAYLMLAPSLNTHGGSSDVPLWFTSNAGRSWSSRQVPCHIGAWSAVLSVAPNGTLMAVCASEPSAGSQIKSVLESSDGGRTRDLKTDSNIEFGYLGAIDLVTSQEAFLVGGRSSLLVTHDGGTLWQPVKPLLGSTAGGTSEVVFFNAAHGLVLGNDDSDNERLTLWSTADGGKHWSSKPMRVE